MIRTYVISALLALCAKPLSAAQQGSPPADLPQAVFTCGTTAVDSAGKPWGYVLLLSPQENTLAGRKLSVYFKGAAENQPGSFKRQGGIAYATDKATASAFIERAGRLGQNTAELIVTLRGLYRRALYPNYLASLHDPPQPGDPPRPEDPPLAGDAPPGEQLALLAGLGASDPDWNRLLGMLSLNSPAIAMATGRAWAGPLPVAVGQDVVLEIRLQENGVDGGVVGRALLKAGAPDALAAPGAPVVVPALLPEASADPAVVTPAMDRLDPAGDLAVRLRWATPDALRRQTLLARGYSVYRTTRAFAQSSGWLAAAPARGVLRGLATTAPASVQLVNALPVLPEKSFTAADVGRFDPRNGGDASTIYIMDDNKRREPGGVPFADGAEYCYFATALDLLGREGEMSLAGLAKVCRQLAPPAPIHLTARDVLSRNVVSNAESHRVDISWQAVPPAPDGTAPSRFDLLRGGIGDDDIGALLDANVGNALRTRTASQLRVFASVPVSAGTGGLFLYTDTQPFIMAGQSCWYAVRAVYDGACGPVYSAPCAPVYVSLQSAEAPVAPASLCHQGSSAPIAVAVPAGSDIENVAAYPAGEGRLQVECTRSHPDVTYARFRVVDGTQEISVDFPAGSAQGDTVSAVFVLTGSERDSVKGVSCTVGTRAGVESNVAWQTASLLPAPTSSESQTTLRMVKFLATAGTVAEPPASEPFRSEVLGPAVAATAVDTYPNGMSSAAVGASLNGQTVHVQRLAAGVWEPAGGAVVAGGRVLVSPVGGALAEQVRVFPLKVPLGDGCTHQRESVAGGVAPVPMGLCLSPNTAEYRVYRRIDDGPLSLVTQGAAVFGNQLLNEAAFQDDALPAVSGQVTYFAQFLDRNGNASPLTTVSDCPLRLIAPLPVPVLKEPTAALDDGQPAMKLSWFCPPPGVERFQIFLQEEGQQRFAIPLLAGAVGVAGQNDPVPDPGRARLTAVPLSTTVNGVVRKVVSRVTMANLPGTLRSVAVDRAFYTGRVGADFQGGPNFTLTVRVQRNVKYSVWIKAIGVTGGTSDPSSQMSFTWSAPDAAAPGPEPRVAWPARPLPPGETFNALAVVSGSLPPGFSEGNSTGTVWPENSGERYSRGVRIGRIAGLGPKSYFTPTVSGFRVLELSAVKDGNVDLRGSTDPNRQLFTNGTERILPAVLYRRQVPSTSFPDVSGDVIQVSPLVSRLAWERVPIFSYEYNSYTNYYNGRLWDPHVAAVSSINPGNTALRDVDFYLLDTQPVIRGASYQYYLVRFRADGEIAGVIDAGQTQID